MSTNYHEEENDKNILKLRECLKELPPFLVDFFRGKAERTTSKTRLGYAQDLKLFFNYLTVETTEFCGKKVTELNYDDLKNITATQIIEFSEYLEYYVKIEDRKEIVMRNSKSSRQRKLSAIRSMFKYFYQTEKIPANTGELVQLPRIDKKAIIQLEVDEVAKLLDLVELGPRDGINKPLTEIDNFIRVRNLALITLLLGTGMRVNECVGIDLTHLDFELNAVLITRKGGAEQILYFGVEVRVALLSYLEVREQIKVLEGSENALFISKKRTRIGVRQIQMLVKNYAKQVTVLKKITPHKLRSTFGTQLYRESGDIFLVADILGHDDVNTTKRHYAKMSDEKRRQAANIIKLRD